MHILYSARHVTALRMCSIGADPWNPGLNPKQQHLYPQASACAEFSDNTWRSTAERHRLSILPRIDLADVDSLVTVMTAFSKL